MNTHRRMSYMLWLVFALLVGASAAPGSAASADAVLIDGSGVTPEKVAALQTILRAMDNKAPRPHDMFAAAVPPMIPEIPATICYDEGTPAETIARIEAERGAGNQLDFNLQGASWSASRGTPRGLVISFVRDGTFIPAAPGAGGGANSVLFQRMDALFAGAGGREAWTTAILRAFDRWAVLSGTSYTFCSIDDRAAFPTSPGAPLEGLDCARGDIRIAMRNIDGPGTVLGFTFPPQIGDMILDASENWASDPGTSFLRLRNVVAHEHGHGLGLSHVCPIDQTKLMENTIPFSFDGPQQDDIRAVHALYGDAYDNASSANAPNLGLLTLFQTSLPSPSPAPAPIVGPLTANARLTSIDRTGEGDFFRFSAVSTPLTRVTLTPIGTTYLSGGLIVADNACSGANVNALRQANLMFEVFRFNCSGGLDRVILANTAALGFTESLTFPTPPTTCGFTPNFNVVIRVSASGTVLGPQLYDLSVARGALATGDFNLDPINATVQANEEVHQTLTWTVPEGEVWRDLKTIGLRIRDDHKTAMVIRWDEAANTFSVCEEGGKHKGDRAADEGDDGKSDDRGDPDRGGKKKGPRILCSPGQAPGTPSVLETSIAQLHLARSSVVGSGPTGTTVTLNLSLKFKSKAAGRTFDVEVAASDDLGHQDDFVLAGSVAVRRSRKADDATPAVSSPETPIEFSAKSIPNPVRQSRTSIRYSIPASLRGSHVDVTILDISGRLVRTLVSEVQGAGHHQVEWDLRDEIGRGVSQGVYLYRVTAGDQHKTQKLIVMRN